MGDSAEPADLLPQASEAADSSLAAFDGRSRNVVFTGADEVEVREEPVPELGPRQLLVASSRTLISLGTELICLQRNFDPGTHWDRWVKYPFYPGYCNVGRVVGVGEEVRAFRPGDRVATRGAHRQFFVLEATRAFSVPEGLTDEEAAWFGLGGIVQTGVRRAEHELGDAVAVIGLGPLGQLVVQYARVAGAREVIAIDTCSDRLDLAAQHGATQWVHGRAEDAVEAVSGFTEGRLADVVYDVTGHPPAFPGALQQARRFGKVILLGDAGRPGEQRLTPDVVTRGLQIRGAHDSHPPAASTDHAYWSHARMAALFFTYLERQQLQVANLITHRYSPSYAPQAYASLAADRSSALGVVFDWSQLE
jgi:2-desacetyl-2-hydroxyethyl bacteriochlorophyllide A dehydrogenase